MSQSIDTSETAKTRARYNRIAPAHSLMEISAEKRFSPWWRNLWSLIPGGRVLVVRLITARPAPSKGRDDHKIGGEDG
jgi:hypothetical protein